MIHFQSSVARPIAAACLGLSLLAGCGSVKREPEVYRADVKAILDAQNEPIRICYENVLKKNPSAAGMVTIKFDLSYGDVHVHPHSTTKEDVVSGLTTAPDDVVSCVIRQLHGLTLEPSDKVHATITWTWEFSSKRVDQKAGAMQ